MPSQLLGELVHAVAAFFHRALLDDAADDEKAGASAEPAPHGHAFERQQREQIFAEKQNDTGHKPARKRQLRVLQRHARHIRDQDGHHELAELQLAHLPLAQQPHQYKQRQKYNDGPEDNVK